MSEITSINLVQNIIYLISLCHSPLLIILLCKIKKKGKHREGKINAGRRHKNYKDCKCNLTIQYM